MTDQPKEIKIDTPEGEIVAHNTTVDPTPQTVTVVVGDDLLWLKSLGHDGPEFVLSYVPGANEPTLKDYDAAFREWQRDESPAFNDRQVIEMFGGYLGNKCIADFGMEWVTVTDEYGTDYAVRSTSVEVMTFPFSTVLKRVEDKKYDFIHGVYYAVKNMLSSGDYKPRDTLE